MGSRTSCSEIFVTVGKLLQSGSAVVVGGRFRQFERGFYFWRRTAVVEGLIRC